MLKAIAFLRRAVLPRLHAACGLADARPAAHAPSWAVVPALLVLGALLLAPALAQAQGGSVLAVGSSIRDDNDLVWDRLVQLAGGPGARVAVFTAPDSEPDLAARLILARLERRGLKGTHIRVGPNIPGQDLAAAVADPQWIAQVQAAQVVFFSGGNQALLMDTLRPGGRDSPLMSAVRAVHARGGVVAGGSAGAAVMSDIAFRDPQQDVLGLMKRTLEAGSDYGQGFGFVRPDVVVDQHLIRRGRIGRLLQLMRQSGRPMGLGLEEHTAVVVRGDEVEVVGQRGVLFVELDAAPAAAGEASQGASAPAGGPATRSPDGPAQSPPGNRSESRPEGPLQVQGARLALLDHGDRVDLATRRVTPAPARQGAELALKLASRRSAADPDAWRGSVFNDMLGEAQFLLALGRLVDSRHSAVRGLSFALQAAADEPLADLGFDWWLRVGPATRAWRTQDNPALTLSGVQLDIVPVRMARPLFQPWPAQPPTPR